MEIEVAELRIAEAHRVCQHGLEYRFELARRARDDLENLRGRGLLLQRLGKVLARLGELAPVFFEFLFQFGVGNANGINVSSRLRSIRTKTASVRSALRPFARQGHLVGAAAALPVGPSQGPGLSILTESHDELAPLYSITSSALFAQRYGILDRHCRVSST